MLFAIDLNGRHNGEDFINVERIAMASMLSLEAPGIHGSKIDTPKTDCFPTNSDASLSEQIFDISVAEIEAIVEPDGVGNDIG